LRDVLTTLRRRSPHLAVILYPTPVQGEGSAQKIAQAIATASLRAECDVLLVCRGGGSIEDLWSFNHEAVARAIAGCTMPVISGVGHETDFTIADFAADLRAPTPTAAAEMASAPRAHWLDTLESMAGDMTRAMRRRLSEASQSLDWLARRLVSPSAYAAHQRLKLQAMQLRLAHATRTPLGMARYAVNQLETRLRAQLPDIAAERRRLAELGRRLQAQAETQQRQRRLGLNALGSQLELLNPQRTLERGYAIITDGGGAVVRSPSQLRPKQVLALRLADGGADVTLASVQPTLD
jgi:exodeoxyribonuclease VII large subunit